MPPSIRLVAVGKIKESYLQAGLAEYEKRLRPFCRLETVELKDEGVAREAERMAKYVDGASAFVLDAEGEAMDSHAFARLLKRHETQTLTFLIGSAQGIAPELKKEARLVSLSKMTFTHEMARLFLLEQIYRGFQINSNRPYHK